MVDFIDAHRSTYGVEPRLDRNSTHAATNVSRVASNGICKLRQARESHWMDSSPLDGLFSNSSPLDGLFSFSTGATRLTKNAGAERVDHANPPTVTIMGDRSIDHA